MHTSVYDFVTRVLGPEEVEGKRILEVGSLDVNGSVRPYVTSLQPAEYIGTDRRRGRRVDRVVSAGDLIATFGCDAFDLVLCLETLEHISKWRIAVFNMLSVLRTGGIWVMTTRSHGFPRHDHPNDYFRFDVREWGHLSLFGTVLELCGDPAHPGMFLAWRKHIAVPMAALDSIHATAAPRD